MKTLLFILFPALMLSQKIHFQENFDKLALGNHFDKNWIVKSIKGKNTWRVSSHRNSKTKKYAKMSGYKGSVKEDDWLILKQNLSSCYTAFLSFQSATGYYKHNGLSVWVSSSPDFSAAKKLEGVKLASKKDVKRGNFSPFVSSGKIDISSYCGAEAYIGFHYVGNNSDQSSTFEIDNIRIRTNH